MTLPKIPLEALQKRPRKETRLMAISKKVALLVWLRGINQWNAAHKMIIYLYLLNSKKSIKERERIGYHLDKKKMKVMEANMVIMN